MFQYKRLQRSIILLIFFLFITILFLSGCSNSRELVQEEAEKQNNIEKIVQLYFPDHDLNRLAREEYSFSGSKEEMVHQIFEQLKTGPRNDQLNTLIPEETRLLNVYVEEDRVTLDLSKDIYKVNIGSAGEALLVGSLVNSLTSGLNVTYLQILVEGQQVESIAGHVYIAEPLRYLNELTVRQGKIPHPSNLQELQSAVQEGHQVWRLDPIEVTRVDGIALGFLPDKDSFVLSEQSSSIGRAVVHVTHGEHKYLVYLVQPLRVGAEHIWVIDEVIVE
ncbi:GerMN domain-containing protein [Heliorestis convoluta]|uniref:GerMN domain-containing protein, putative n=1 Tax=Heliorestis convoluta TaxID=356322 RepID=A0A5Q2N6R0_9FIRM|nr:GerMN domain-containing protein [Heliorestis convoluta]QGG49316.1 GerMN domain-containing protein, putative [Heliorestis convoluta]